MLLRWITARGYRITLILAAVFAAFHVFNELRVLSGGPANFVQRLEMTAQDVKFAVRGERTPDTWHVAVAAVDETAIQRFGPLPWDRSRHAELVERLTDLGAGAIVFDMTFDRPSGKVAQRTIDAVMRDYRQVGLVDAPSDLIRVSQQARKRSRRSRKRLRSTVQKTLRDAALKTRRVASRLENFRRRLDTRSSMPEPDRLFADAIRQSGRVILGMVAYSRHEAEALARVRAAGSKADISNDNLDAKASDWRVNELSIDDRNGLTRIVRSPEHFASGLYHQYFDLQSPTPMLAGSTEHFGIINAVPDEDGVNRRMPLVSAVKGSTGVVPSLALKAAQVVLNSDRIEVVGDPSSAMADAIRISPITVQTELGATTTLDWLTRFEPDRFPIVSVVDILDGNISADAVRKRAVFVAATAIGTHDQRVTPLEPAVPGVYIHATVAQNLLENRQLLRPAFGVLLEVVLLLVIGIIAGIVMGRFRLWGQVVTAAALAAGWISIDYFLFTNGLVVAVVMPVFLIFASLLAMSMWSYLVEQRERRKTRRAFGQYLSPAVLDRVLAEPEEYLKLGGRRYDATVLFSDIRGFTTISESLSPEALGRMLNEYMTPMTKIVFAYQGTLDKYIGDAIMAFWGAPVEEPQHALLACRAALKMQKEVVRVNKGFARQKLPKIQIGIGISSGSMTIGNMGSDDLFAYTALGDCVNLGARLEGHTKEYGVRIIISESTYRRVSAQMLCRELGRLRVRGRA
ncbi:MAG: adenylate/guanylate cyclase domain-containing protein, partial [Myxococcota bacterium]